MNIVNCIKCGEKYEEEDVDPYYCTKCLVEKNKLAEEINKKIASKPRKQTKSGLKIYDEAAQNGIRGFPKASDLGIL